ncbi:MAG TPA: NADH-quinone oxidoreductase subunit N [Anaerolineales bacterium]|nr:NADH-quinone oxidoreductase subunit N [Anaerolineales bacterium]
MFGNIDTTMILAILPEILLLVLAALLMVLDLLWDEEGRRFLGWVSAGGLVVILVVSLAVARPGEESSGVWGGMLRDDWLGFVFKMLFIFGAAITSLFAMEVKALGRRGEFYLLLLVSTIGMNLMASAGDLIMLYLAIETTSIPLYILAGFFKTDSKSTEAGFKYLLFGALTSTVMLYGFSLFYGFTGTTDITALTQTVLSGELPFGLVLGTLMLVLVGFGFKISVVPFHFWAPDVYEGAPTPVAGFLSTASKAAGFAVLMRVLLVAFPVAVPYWAAILAALSTASMTLGNALALAQRNIKRLLAYSSIAHAGYALIGVAAVSSLGIAAAVFYLLAYVITNLAAFGAVAAFSRVSGSDEIADYAALSRRAPGLSLVMLVAFLSLAGMPPLGGFVAKVFVFAAAVRSNLVWLAMVGVLNSIVGLYYYLIVLKVVYLYRSEDEDKPVPLTRSYSIALVVLVAGIILVGTVFAPWFGWSNIAAAALFPPG